MASINYAAREISVKIVYYGPGLSGKTTNLQVIHRKVPPEYKSDMVSLATETDRTLFFDFLPLDLGKIKGFSTKFQLYTVPGQVYYNATRKLVLRGVDGIVFVADSAADKLQENLESFQNLEENLAEYGYQKETIPIIIQYNKRDLPNAMSIEELEQHINKFALPYGEAVANKGKGVFDSLKQIGKIVIDQLNKKYSRQSRPMSGPSASQSAPQRPSQPYSASDRYPTASQKPPQQYYQPEPQQRRAAPPPQPMQRPPRSAYPPPQQSLRQPPQQGGFRPPQPQQHAYPADTNGDMDTFEPAQQRTVPAPTRMPQQPQRPAALSQQEEYFDYGSIELESMSGPRAQQIPAPAPVQNEFDSAPSTQEGNKTDLDLEIEKYQREIEEKQRRMRTTPPAPSSGKTGYIPNPAQQAQPPQHQFTQPVDENDYDVYNMGSQSFSAQNQQQAAPRQQPPSQAQQPLDEGDDMFFTSVNTDRSKKPIKRPINPRTRPQKGFLGKLFNKEEP